MRRARCAAAVIGLAIHCAACGESSDTGVVTSRKTPVAPTAAGVPEGWKPVKTHRGDLVVNRARAVVQDLLIVRGDIIVKAPDVTVRRVKLQGGRITNANGGCSNNLLVEDSTLEPPPGERFSTDAEGAIGVGGYTARGVKLWRRAEGFRSGGASDGCGPVRIEGSLVKIALPRHCSGDPHADGLQGFDSPRLTIRHVIIDFSEATCGTAPVFIPAGQGNGFVDIDRLLVIGGGYAFRVRVPGRVKRFQVANKSWAYGPLDVDCSLMASWDAALVTVRTGYKVHGPRRRLACK